MGPAGWANATLRFALELAMLAGMVVGALAIAWPLAIVLPVAAAVAWGRWLAPRAPRPLRDPSRIGLEGGLFATATAGWVTGAGATPSALFAIAAAVHLPLTFVLGQRG